MSLVARNFEILKAVIEDGFRLAFDHKLWRRKRLAAQLQLHLFKVVQVDVTISARPDELADIQVALLSDHVGQQRIRNDIERNAEKDVRRSLVKLAGEFAVGDVELKQRVAGL